MSFTDHRSKKNRPAILVAVAVLHAAAIYAIVTGLGVAYYERIIGNLPSTNYKIDPPPPPEPPKPKPTEKAQDIPNSVAKPKPMPWDPGDSKVPYIPLPVPSPPIGPINIDPPKPLPSFTPVGPRPRGNPGLWATTNDYPTKEIREGNEGTARFLLSIDARGEVQDCIITRSSGHPGLDNATCGKVSRRARFEPATDANGSQVAGTFAGSIKWVIPE
jgi:protein TonB